MKRWAFSDICRLSRLAEAKRVDAKGGVILIADSSVAQRWHDGNGNLQYKTVWAWGRDEEHLDIAQPLFFDCMFETNGVWRNVTEEVRVMAAEHAAQTWLETNAANVSRGWHRERQEPVVRTSA